MRVLPSYGEAAFGLADLLEGRGRIREAVHALIDMLTADPYAVDALIRLADLLVKDGRVRDAEQAYHRVLRLHPNDARATVALADIEAGR
jgi:cytochrome c-type biogenesis protein CcmH/NrfG